MTFLHSFLLIVLALSCFNPFWILSDDLSRKVTTSVFRIVPTQFFELFRLLFLSLQKNINFALGFFDFIGFMSLLISNGAGRSAQV